MCLKIPKKVKLKLLFWFTFMVLYFHSITQSIYTNIAHAAGILASYGGTTASPYGGGVSFVDFDRDGLDDLSFATDNGMQILFYKNLGNNTFTSLSLISNTAAVKGILWVDVDNDGDLDLYLNVYLGQNRLYLNSLSQSGVFSLVDNTILSGLKIQNDPSYGAAFGDFDQDGDLDLFVSNRSEGGNQFANVFYKNNGNGTFVDSTLSVGILNEFTPDFCSVFFDFDNDGDLDLYTIVDKYSFPNRLYKNSYSQNGVAHFTEVGSAIGLNISIGAMNAGVADYNNDGLFDVYVTNEKLVGNSSTANHQMLCQYFSNMYHFNRVNVGTNVDQICWGASFLDVDNDKDLDLYVCSERQNNPSWRNYLFKNLNDGYFEEYETGGLSGDTLDSFGNAVGDINNDGKMDIAVNNSIMDSMQLWLNNSTNTNHFIKFSLKGTTSNTFGIGSRIEICDEDSQQTRFTHCGINYLGQNSLLEHVGMGNSTTVDSLIIKWSSGGIEKYYNLSVDTSYQFVEGACLNQMPGSSANKYIGPNNGNIHSASNWSKGKVPSMHDDVIIESSSPISLTNNAIFKVRSLTLKNNITFHNNATMTLEKSYGIGVLIESSSALINSNSGVININEPCGEAMKVIGTFNDFGSTSIVK